MVHFVGAGSGAEDLITVRGMRLLQQADVIIYTGSLINPALLKYAREDAALHNSAYLTLEEVMALMEEGAGEGKEIVRLHTGEPSLYGAVREQMDLLEEHRIAYDSTPGVSACFGAAADLNLEYTLPGVSQSLIITRMEGRTPVPEKESIEKLAAHRASMAVYLSAGRLQELAAALIEGGYPPDTPAAIVYKATWPEEQRILCTVASLPEEGKKNHITKTAVILVGDAIAHSRYEKSRLYAPDFSTEYRMAKEDAPAKDKVTNAGEQLHIISFTQTGAALSEHLSGQIMTDSAEKFRKQVSDGLVEGRLSCRLYSTQKLANANFVQVEGPVSDWAKERMRKGIPMLFIGATGIAVRAIAPFLRDKLTDPPVLVMDEKGEHIIPILSGHVGGANALARYLASVSEAEAVITTATDLEEKFRVDVFAKKNHLAILNREQIAGVSARLLAGKKITCSVDKALRPGEDFRFPDQIIFTEGALPEAVDVWIGQRNPGEALEKPRTGLILSPRVYLLGIGCKKGKSCRQIEAEADRQLAEWGIGYEDVYAVSSIDLKKEEPGLVEFCLEKRLPFLTFSAAQLSQTEGEFTGSGFVKQQTGVDNVCERAAVAGGGQGCKLVRKKAACNGITMALAKRKWGLDWNAS